MPVRLLLSALLITLAGSVTPARTAPSLAALNVQLGDLPHGWILTTQVSGDPSGLQRAGFAPAPALLVGMVNQNGRFFTPPAQGLPALEAVVGRYRSVAAAHAAWLPPTPIRGKPILGAVGDERWSELGELLEYHHQHYAAGAFRRGQYVVLLLLTNLPRSYPPTRLAALGRLVDNRLQQTQ